jgi:hypothetical protein
MNSRQYTLRNVSVEVDQVLRRLARERHKSLNQVAVETLEQAVGTAEPSKRRDLSDLMGTWRHDPETAAALADQRRVESATRR